MEVFIRNNVQQLEADGNVPAPFLFQYILVSPPSPAPPLPWLPAWVQLQREGAFVMKKLNPIIAKVGQTAISVLFSFRPARESFVHSFLRAASYIEGEGGGGKEE